MSRKSIKWLDGIGYKPPGERQREWLGGRLMIPTNEENIDKLCDSIRSMAKMYREMDEEWLNVDMKKNEGDRKPFVQYSFERSTWSQAGDIPAKIEQWEKRGSEDTGRTAAALEEKSDPFEDDDDLPF